MAAAARGAIEIDLEHCQNCSGELKLTAARKKETRSVASCWPQPRYEPDVCLEHVVFAVAKRLIG